MKLRCTWENCNYGNPWEGDEDELAPAYHGAEEYDRCPYCGSEVMEVTDETI